MPGEQYQNIDEQNLKELPEDADLVNLITGWETESNSYHDELKKEQDACEQYYLGNQTKRDRVPAYLSNHVTNRVFEAIETAVPIITSKSPEFDVKPNTDSEDDFVLAEDIQNILAEEFDTLDVKEKIEVAVRHMMLFRFGVLKPFYNEEIKGIDVRYVRPQLIYIPKYGQSVHELPYIMEKQNYTAQDLEDNFDAEAIKNVVTVSTDKEGGEPTKLYQVWEVHTNDWTAWKSGGIILKKNKNEYFDWDSGEKNFFEYARKPYIFLTTFSYGKGLVSSPSTTYQSIPIADAINVIIRKVIDHATKMGNGAWMVDKEVMTFEEAKEKINNAAGIILHGNGVARQDMVRRDSPTPLPGYFFSMLQSLNSQFDNLWGLHSTTRGERQQQETATGRQLLKQADIGRMDMFVRTVERAVDDLGDWFLQLMKMFYDQEKVYQILSPEGTARFIKFKGSSIKKGFKVRVKAGSTLPTDRESEATRAIQLFQLGALDPITLYRKLNYSNPEQMAEMLMKWKTGQLTQVQMPQAPANKVSESMSFKDLPAEGKVQMAKQAGIEISPQSAQQMVDTGAKQQIPNNK